jgi:hypothetical protein
MSEAETWNGVMGGGNPAPSCAQKEVDAVEVGLIIGVVASAIAAGSAYVSGKVVDKLTKE